MDAALYSEALDAQASLRAFYRTSEACAAVGAMAQVGGAATLNRLEGAGVAIFGEDGPPTAATTFDRLAASIRLPLELGVPFFMAPPIATTLSMVAAGMPDWTLTLDSVPVWCGFLWCALPLPLPAPEGHVGQAVRAMGWSPFYTHVESTEDRGPYGLVQTDRPPDGFNLTLFLTVPEAGRWPIPLTTLTWPVGETITGALSARRSEDARAGQRYRMKLTYWAAFLAFIAQRIWTAPPLPADRGARRRWTKAAACDAPLVRVVQLRRATASAHGEHAGSVEWQCQWFVSGHWRQQPCGPGRVNRRPTWVLPYVKGPADKPLKPPSTKVFAVVR